jgi:hypothetical protein
MGAYALEAGTVMSAIQVELAGPTKLGRLYPQIVEGVLSLESAPRRQWPYGVNVDYSLILDLDSSHTLAHVELLDEKRLWKVVDPFPDKPYITRKANLVFPKHIIEHEIFEQPVKVVTDKRKDHVLIWFGGTLREAAAVELSENCLALVEDNQLLGFYVTLVSPS